MKNESFIRLPQVVAMTGLSSTTIWRYEKKGLFPKRIKVTLRTTAWKLSEVQSFIDKTSNACV